MNRELINLSIIESDKDDLIEIILSIANFYDKRLKSHYKRTF